MRPSRRTGSRGISTFPSAARTGDFGLSQPVIDGSAAIAVGADADRRRATSGAARDSGPSTGTTDRRCRPPSPTTPSRRILIYTEGFGDSPPGSSGDSLGERELGQSRPPLAIRGEVPSIRMSRRSTSTRSKPVWDAPVPTARRQPNRRHGRRGHRVPRRQRRPRLRLAVATGEIRWTVDAGGFLTTPPAVSNDLVIVAVQGDRSSRPRLVAYHESDGSRAWSDDIQGERSSRRHPRSAAIRSWSGSRTRPCGRSRCPTGRIAGRPGSTTRCSSRAPRR